MARVMEGMQESQAQQLQLMTQLNSFTRYIWILEISRKNEQRTSVMNTWTMVLLLFNVI